MSGPSESRTSLKEPPAYLTRSRAHSAVVDISWKCTSGVSCRSRWTFRITFGLYVSHNRARLITVTQPSTAGTADAQRTRDLAWAEALAGIARVAMTLSSRLRVIHDGPSAPSPSPNSQRTAEAWPRGQLGDRGAASVPARRQFLPWTASTPNTEWRRRRLGSTVTPERTRTSFSYGSPSWALFRRCRTNGQRAGGAPLPEYG